MNKAVRQATFIAAVVAQFIADKGAVDVLNDGDLAGIGIKLISALNKTSQPLDATLTAIASLVGAANKLPYFNGADTAALTELTAFARELLGLSDAAGVLSKLGLKTAALRDECTWATQIPDMSNFLSSVSASAGYQQLPGGLAIQFGTSAIPTGGTSTITLPKAA